MSRREKVREENRKRVAEACELCKRAHQKCDGEYPCKRCKKHRRDCVKHSMLRADGSISPVASASTSSSLDMSRVTYPTSNLEEKPSPTGSGSHSVESEFADRFRIGSSLAGGLAPRNTAPGEKGHKESKLDKAYKVHIEARILQDHWEPLFVGPESVWSFLQAIRLAVDHKDVMKQQIDAFKEDKYRFSMEEPPSPPLPPGTSIPSPPPGFEERKSLANIFLTSTAGLVEILDQERFEDCLAKPQDVSRTELCSLYLVLAIGSLLSGPQSGSNRMKMFSNAELYCTTAKYYCDPGLQLAEPSSHAATLFGLMALYEIMLAKWKTAYRYIGTAVRIANSIGLHQTALVIDDGESRMLKHNRWRSLFILETIISAVLGLPTSIEVSHNRDEFVDAVHRVPDEGIHLETIRATFNACQTIDQTVKAVYRGNFVGESIATGILRQVSGRDNQRLGSRLDPQRLLRGQLRDQASSVEVASITNIDVVESFSTMLLTRSFFYTCVFKDKATWESDASLRSLAEACVASSNRTISALHAYSQSSTGPSNPLYLHFCFTAAITLLSNEYFGVFDNSSHYPQMMEWAKHMFDSSRLSDAHTKSLVHIVNVFEDLVESSSSTPTTKGSKLPTRDNTGPGHDFAEAGKYATGIKRSASTSIRNAPYDSRASMAPPVAGGHPGQGHQSPWPQQPLLSQAHYGTAPQNQNVLAPVFQAPTGDRPQATYVAYTKYPALEGLGPQVSAGAPHPDVYSSQPHYPPNPYWRQ